MKAPGFIPRGWRSRRRAIRRARKAPPPAPFVVGATRSGTTLLRLMLDAHPEIAIPSETHFIPDLIKARERYGASRERMIEMLTSHRRWGDFQITPEELDQRWGALEAKGELNGPAAVREFFAIYQDKHGSPPRYGDKTPGYVKHMREIQLYLPEARFIHLIRDGRDVALSILKQSFGPETVEAAAERWRSRVLRGRSQAPYLGYYLEVKFEDLVLDTEGQLRRICEFLELEFDPAMLGYHETAPERLKEKARALSPTGGDDSAEAERRYMSHAKTFEPPNPSLVGGYKTKMDAESRASYEALAGDLLIELGYGAESLVDADGAEVQMPKARRRGPQPLRRAGAAVARLRGNDGGGDDRLPAPFLVGAARSGTNLLRVMLDAHPDLTMVSNTGFVAKLAEKMRSEPMTAERVTKVIAAAKPLSEYGIDEAELQTRFENLHDLKAAPVLREFYAVIAEKGGTSRFGDETPAYLKRMRRIQRALSEARFVHVIRDGRDTAAAKPGTLDPGKALTIGQRWERKVASARNQEHLVNHYLEVRYEDLIADPEEVLREVCEFCDLEFDPAMIDPPERAALEAELGPVGHWKTALGSDDTEAFGEVAGRLLGELGYSSS